MTYQEIVSKVQKNAINSNAVHICYHIAIQFNIYGEGEGAFYVEIDRGRIFVMPYEYYDRDAVVYVNAETLMGVLSGELPISDVANNGQLVIQGNHDATIKVLETLVVKENDNKKNQKNDSKTNSK